MVRGLKSTCTRMEADWMRQDSSPTTLAAVARWTPRVGALCTRSWRPGTPSTWRLAQWMAPCTTSCFVFSSSITEHWTGINRYCIGYGFDCQTINTVRYSLGIFLFTQHIVCLVLDLEADLLLIIIINTTFYMKLRHKMNVNKWITGKSL